ncbi:MAG: hypothetical protein RQ745_10385 [Longimicrobiales bacterium]|nr:hypothetical protein [Longimicrobiales bacterium]
MRGRPPARVVRLAAHLSGVVGAGVCLLFAAGLTIPTSDEFPDSLWVSFHTFFVGAVVGDDDALSTPSYPARRRSSWSGSTARTPTNLRERSSHLPVGGP